MTRLILFLAGLLAALTIVACGELSPEQATKDAKDEARKTYDKQVDALDDLEFPEGQEVETLLKLSSVNMKGGFCGLRADNEIFCWGEGHQLSGKFTSISGGSGHICGLRENGNIECAGMNTAYQQGGRWAVAATCGYVQVP